MPKTLNVQQTLDNGKSIVIMPKYKLYGKQIFWGEVTGNKYYMKSLIENSISISQDYTATPIDVGTYYIKWTQIKNWQEKEISNKEKHISNIGEANLERSPIKEKIKRHGKYTSHENREKIVDIDPIYKTTYYFSENQNSSKAIGFLTVNPHEIILIPNIWFEIVLVENSCRFADELRNKFLFQVMHDIATNFSDDFKTLRWICPIKVIIVNVKKSSIDDFTLQMNQEDFSKELSKQVSTRNFEFGNMFKNAKKIESLEDGVERYIIDGSTNKSE
jgi:hypothetical protein